LVHRRNPRARQQGAAPRFRCDDGVTRVNDGQRLTGELGLVGEQCGEADQPFAARQQQHPVLLGEILLELPTRDPVEVRREQLEHRITLSRGERGLRGQFSGDFRGTGFHKSATSGEHSLSSSATAGMSSQLTE